MSDLQMRTGQLRQVSRSGGRDPTLLALPESPEEAAVGPGADAGRPARPPGMGLPRRPRPPAPARAAPRAGLAGVTATCRASITPTAVRCPVAIGSGHPGEPL